MPPTPPPITVALIDDYDVVLIGLAHMFDGYADKIVVAEIDANATLHDSVDIALYDTFAQPEADCDDINVLIDNPRARRAVIYTWNFHPELIATALEKGANGYLSKTLPALPRSRQFTPESSSSVPPRRSRSRPSGWTGRAAMRA